jgi:hypothetical protein
MPILTPEKGEQEKAFVSRFLANAVASKAFPEEKQRAAIGYAVYRNSLVNDAPAAGPKFLKPSEDDDMNKFIEKFMLDPYTMGEFPNSNERRAIATFLWKDKENSDDVFKEGLLRSMSEPARPKPVQNAADDDEWPRPVTARFILPGLVHYEDLSDGQGSTILVQKPMLDKMLNSFIGKPVVNENHRPVHNRDFNMGNADGIVSKAWYNADDGYYYCDMLVWDPETRKNMESGYSVSCAYVVKEWNNEGGTFSNIPYQREAVDGEYTHMAIVSNPRYEQAHIFNAIKGGCMSILKMIFKGKDEKEQSIDLDTKTSLELGNGKSATIEEMANSYLAAEKLREEEAKKPKDDTLIDLGNGKKISLGDLKKQHAETLANAESSEMKKEHEDGDHKDYKENCGMCSKERKNAEDKEAKEKEEKDRQEAERKNAVERARKETEDAEGRRAAERLDNAARLRRGELGTPSVSTLDDGIQRGKAMFGFHDDLKQPAAPVAK